MMFQPLKRRQFLFSTLVVSTLLASCGGSGSSSGKGSVKDSVKTVAASVDETYLPVLQQVIEMFHYHYPKQDVVVKYKPEREAINDLLTDKCKVAIVSRGASDNEKARLDYEGKIKIHETLMGFDAVTLIVNKENPIKKISVENLKKLLSGEISNWKLLGGPDSEIIIVFDNQASGTVRYMKDSLLVSTELPKNVFSAKTNPEVIRYVGETQQAVGFIGQAWMSDKDSPQVQEYLAKVEKLALKAEGLPDLEENYYLPYQTEIKLCQYPLSRRIYCLNRESTQGTGTDFVYFFASDIGQRVLLKAGLLPEFMPPRPISFKQEK